MTPDVEYPQGDRIRLAFTADTADEAIARAKDWVRNEGALRLKTVCSARRGEGQMWHVELSVAQR